MRALSPHKWRVLQVLARASILSGCVVLFLLREFSTPAEGTLLPVGQLGAVRSWKSV